MQFAGRCSCQRELSISIDEGLEDGGGKGGGVGASNNQSFKIRA